MIYGEVMSIEQIPLTDTPSDQHEISTEPILDHAIALRPGLVKIVVSKTCAETGEITKFSLPVQWEPQEAADLIHQIRGLTWQLSDEDGLPGDYEGIRDVCHQYLFEKVGFVEPISIRWEAKYGR